MSSVTAVVEPFNIALVQSARLKKHFEKSHAEFVRTKAALKSAVHTYLLTMQDEGNVSVSIVVPFLKRETDVGEVARTEVCVELKSAGIDVLQSAPTDNGVLFVIRYSSVTPEKLHAFENMK
jgi:hypothetical protein